MLHRIIRFFLDRPLWLAALGAIFLGIIFVAWFIWRGARIAKLEAEKKSLDARLSQSKIDASLAKSSEAREAYLQQADRLQQRVKEREQVLAYEAKTYDEAIQAVKNTRSWQELDLLLGRGDK